MPKIISACNTRSAKTYSSRDSIVVVIYFLYTNLYMTEKKNIIYIELSNFTKPNLEHHSRFVLNQK